jgi:Fe-S-cluster-containing dehydrogenase component
MKILFVSKNFENTRATDFKKFDPEELLMVIDVDRCISCGACQLACQLEHSDASGMPGTFRPVHIQGENDARDSRTLYLPLACRHCESPCDYYSPYNFWTTCPSGKGKDQKIISCDFCIDRVQRGIWPACATRCSMKAIYFGHPEDIAFVLGEKRLREMGDVKIPG